MSRAKNNMIEIPTEQTFERLQMRLPVEVIERLKRFHVFVQQEHGQTHASFDRVMEYVFEEYFGGTRGAVKQFRSWTPKIEAPVNLEAVEAEKGDEAAAE